MPYSVKKIGNYWQTITTATGKVHGTHGSKEEAEAQLRALYANAEPGKEKKKN